MSQTAVMVSVVMPVFWAMKDGIVKGMLAVFTWTSLSVPAPLVHVGYIC